MFLKTSDRLWNYSLVMKLVCTKFADKLVYNIVTGNSCWYIMCCSSWAHSVVQMLSLIRCMCKSYSQILNHWCKCVYINYHNKYWSQYVICYQLQLTIACYNRGVTGNQAEQLTSTDTTNQVSMPSRPILWLVGDWFIHQSHEYIIFSLTAAWISLYLA